MDGEALGHPRDGLRKVLLTPGGRNSFAGSRDTGGAHGITVKHQGEMMGSSRAQFKEFLLNYLQANVSFSLQGGHEGTTVKINNPPRLKCSTFTSCCNPSSRELTG